MNFKQCEPIWPLTIDTETIPPSGKRLTLKPDEQVRQALAALGDLLSLDDYEAQCELKPIRRKGGFTLTGSFKARLVYQSVRTLEPVPSEIKADFQETFLPTLSEKKKKNQTEDAFSVTESDPPLYYKDHALPLGELLCELLMLELDPYPHLENEIPVERLEDTDDDTSKVSPFARLKDLTNSPEDQ